MNISPKLIIRILSDILKGLKQIHHEGYIHRNLKSENILINVNKNLIVEESDTERAIVNEDN